MAGSENVGISADLWSDEPFSSAMGGMMAAMGSLVGHVLYGSLLGVIASAPEPRLAHA